MRLLKYSILILLSFIAISACSQTVYKTPSGAKYHIGSCRMVKNVSEELSIEQALQLGLQPCKICRPEIENGKGIRLSGAKGESKRTVQCNGYTKSGNRCRHRTSIANGYCYQHQPG